MSISKTVLSSSKDTKLSFTVGPLAPSHSMHIKLVSGPISSSSCCQYRHKHSAPKDDCMMSSLARHVYTRPPNMVAGTVRRERYNHILLKYTDLEESD